MGCGGSVQKGPRPAALSGTNTLLQNGAAAASNHAAGKEAAWSVLMSSSPRGEAEGGDQPASEAAARSRAEKMNACRSSITARSSLMQKISAPARAGYYDLIVIGGGPAGVKAACEAAGRGQRVGMIEPSKVITGAPSGAHSKCLREAVLGGAKTWEEVEAVLTNASSSAEHQTIRALRTFHVEVLKGNGFVMSATQVRFSPNDGQPQKELTCEAICLATGSASNQFPPIPFKDHGVFDSDSIWGISYIPETLVLQGAGIIGLEYGLIFSKLGSKVIIIETFGKMVGMLDSSLQEGCVKMMKDAGVEIYLNTSIKDVVVDSCSSADAPRLKVEALANDAGASWFIDCDCILAAPGRHGKSGNIGLECLEAQGLKFGRGKFIEIDENCWTGVGKVYAVGDVAGGNLATVGQAHAARAMRHCFGNQSGKMETEKGKVHKPSGVWTIPEIAWSGLTEEKAIETVENVGTATVEYAQTYRGCVSGEDGFLKLVYDRDTGIVLGVHIMGDIACDLVNYGAEVVNNQDTIFDMLQFVFPAVTYHELYHLAATEAKIRLTGVTSLAGATAWKLVKETLHKQVQNYGGTKTADQILAQAFKDFDADGSGFICKNELKRAMTAIGLDLSDQDVEEMMSEATGDPEDENVDYKQFLKIL